jgi:hypothetical protein
VLPETVVALFVEQDQQKACTGSNSTIVNDGIKWRFFIVAHMFWI